MISTTMSDRKHKNMMQKKMWRKLIKFLGFFSNWRRRLVSIDQSIFGALFDEVSRMLYVTSIWPLFLLMHIAVYP